MAGKGRRARIEVAPVLARSADFEARERPQCHELQVVAPLAPSRTYWVHLLLGPDGLASTSFAVRAADVDVLLRQGFGGSVVPEGYRASVGSLGVDGGELILAPDPRFVERVSAVAPPGVRERDVAIAVDARPAGEAGAERLLLVACRNVGTPTGYRLDVQPAAGWFRLVRIDAEGPTLLVPLAYTRAIARDGNAVNRLELRCVGSQISAAINGVPVAAVEDSTHQAEGVVLFGALGMGQSTEARFDNLVVSRP